MGSLKSKNILLLVKWLWRLQNGNNSFWCKVIQGLHKLNRKPWNKCAKKTLLGVWQNITKSLDDLDSLDISPDDIFKQHVISGNNTLFWKHKWIGSNTLQVQFLVLYSLESLKSCYIDERIGDNGFKWACKSTPTSAQAQLQLTNLNSLLCNHIFLQGPVKFLCMLNLDGDFTTESARRLTDSKVANRGCDPIEWLKRFR